MTGARGVTQNVARDDANGSSPASGAATSSGRIAALEGLRGLAGVVVVARHSLNAVQMPLPLRRALLEGPLAPLLNAQGAVQLFFVLSGYVLARSLSRHSGMAE